MKQVIREKRDRQTEEEAETETERKRKIPIAAIKYHPGLAQCCDDNKYDMLHKAACRVYNIMCNLYFTKYIKAMRRDVLTE